MVEAVNEQPVGEPPAEWAVVEIMGHIKLAGRIYEERRFGATLLRVDVPTTEEGPPYSRFFGGHAIFSITPCDEATARKQAAESYRPSFLYLEQPRLPRLATSRSDDAGELEVELDVDPSENDIPW